MAFSGTRRRGRVSCPGRGAGAVGISRGVIGRLLREPVGEHDRARNASRAALLYNIHLLLAAARSGQRPSSLSSPADVLSPCLSHRVRAARTGLLRLQARTIRRKVLTPTPAEVQAGSACGEGLNGAQAQ